MSGAASIDELFERIDSTLDEHPGVTTLAIARKMANDTGLVRYQQEQESLLEQFGAAQEAKRAADHRLSVANDYLSDVTADAEWTMSSHFDVRSNKTWLVIDENNQPVAEADQRSLTADEKKAWIARRAAATDTVRRAAADVATAQEAVREAADRLALLDRSLSAVKHALDAAREHLVTVRAAITANRNGAH